MLCHAQSRFFFATFLIFFFSFFNVAIRGKYHIRENVALSCYIFVLFVRNDPSPSRCRVSTTSLNLPAVTVPARNEAFNASSAFSRHEEKGAGEGEEQRGKVREEEQDEQEAGNVFVPWGISVTEVG